MGPIPGWNADGVLDPVDVNDTLSFNRSPYSVTLLELVQHFNTSDPRRDILLGFLRYRAALHALGIVNGFQWVDGSFVEHIEANEKRPPNDIDIITFYSLPEGESQRSILAKAPHMFPRTKEQKAVLRGMYKVDGMMSSLDAKPVQLVKQVAFWYGVWAHRRDFLWKGFLQIDLAPNDIDAANAIGLKEEEELLP